jgi:hypothetical protein
MMAKFLAAGIAGVVIGSAILAIAQQNPVAVRPPFPLNYLANQGAHSFLCNPTAGSAALQACGLSSAFSWNGSTLDVTSGGGGPTGWHYLTPSGGGAGSDYNQIQTALNTGNPVMLSGGGFDVCQTLAMNVPGQLFAGVGVNWIGDWGFQHPNPNTWIHCGGSGFTGTAYVQDNANYSEIRGINVMGSSGDHADCFQVTTPASGATLSNLMGQNCDGNGIHVVSDGNVLGEENAYGRLGQTHIFYSWMANNRTHGLFLDTVNGGNVVDPIVDFFNAGANGGDGIRLGLHDGGQIQIINTKMDYNLGRCYTQLAESYVNINLMICDNNYCATYCEEGNTQFFMAGGAEWTPIVLTNMYFMNRNGTVPTAITIDYPYNYPVNLIVSGVSNTNLPALFKLTPNTILLPTSSLQVTASTSYAGLFADTHTAQQLEPLLALQGTRSVQPVLTGATFGAWSFAGGVRSIEFNLSTSCTPCTIPSPAFVPTPGVISGQIIVRQSASGNGTVNWPSDFLTSTLPTLSTAAGAADHMPFVTDAATGKIILFAPALNVH